MSRGLGKLQRAILDVLPWLDPYDERKRLRARDITKLVDPGSRVVPGSIYHALYALKRRSLVHNHRGWARLPADPDWRLAVITRRNEVRKKGEDDLVMQLVHRQTALKSA